VSAGRAVLLALLGAALASPVAAADNDLPGWDRTHWGMTSKEIAAVYGDRITAFDKPVEFYHLHSDLALRRAPLAGHDFTVYFQMSDKTKGLAQILLERRKQYASAEVWRDLIAGLSASFGPPEQPCDQAGRPGDGVPAELERVWILPTTTIRASYLAFGARSPERAPQDDGGLGRRLLVRYAPTRPGEAACR
jgi:hypothetical protein